jgi:predicted Zn-dependent peptidase
VVYSACKEVKPMKIIDKTLKNGLKLSLVPMKDSLAVTVMVLVSAGSRNENKHNNGISHFLEHMCFKGTKKRPTVLDISTELDLIGSEYNAFTDYEVTGYYAKAHPKNINTLIDVLSDIYINPVFDKKEIEKEKGVIIEEINMYEDTPNKQIHDLFMKALYGNSPAGQEILGSKQNVSKITQKDIVNYRRKHYVAKATKIIVSGNFNTRNIKSKIEKAFSSVSNLPKTKKNKIIEKQKEPVLYIKKKKTDQTHLVLGVRTFRAKSKKTATLKVIDAVLGGGMSSRLFQKLREDMGVGYYINTSVDEYTDYGNFNVYIGVDNTRVQEVIRAILNEFRTLKEISVPESELKKAKEFIFGNTALSLESSDAVAEYVGMQVIAGNKLHTLDDLTKQIKRVTSDDIKKLAKEIFVNNRLVLAMIGNIKNQNEIKNVLNF